MKKSESDFEGDKCTNRFAKRLWRTATANVSSWLQERVRICDVDQGRSGFAFGSKKPRLSPEIKSGYKLYRLCRKKTICFLWSLFLTNLCELALSMRCTFADSASSESCDHLMPLGI